MSDKLIDREIIQWCEGTEKLVFCTVCPKKGSVYRTMEIKNLKKHVQQDGHMRRAGLQKATVSFPPGFKKHLKSNIRSDASQIVNTSAGLLTTHDNLSLSSGSVNNSTVDIDDSIMDVDVPAEDTNTSPAEVQPEEPLLPLRVDLDESVPLFQLWADKTIGSRVVEINSPRDLFSELQEMFASGDALFATPLAPLSQERELFDDGMPNFGIQLPDDGQYEKTNTKSNVSPASPTYPWTSKAHFITSLLFSTPRLPFSEAQKKAVLNWAKELGARDVLTLHAIKTCQMQLENLVGDPTKKVTARTGDIFYINNVAEAIAKDYANPLTRLAMQDYPEDSGRGMSQVFNGQKMLLELPSPPAIHVSGSIYFVNKLLQNENEWGGYFIPGRFFLGPVNPVGNTNPGNGLSDKVLYALGWAVERTDAGFIVNEQQEIMSTSSFKRSFKDISACHGELDCGLTESLVKYATLAPNPLRKKSEGQMVYSIPLIIFMDDVSGNISKQWNKHHAIYMSNTNLPREMLEKEFCVRFVTSSPHAPPMELMRAMKASICQAAESGVVTWDCKHEEEVMLVPYGLFVAGDNPMQAEECSHAGINCNYFCRICDVGGTKKFKESEAGYNSIFSSGNLQTPEGTLNTIWEQFGSALKSGATDKIKASVSSTGVCDTSSSFIMNTLVELGKKLRKHSAGSQAKSESEVMAILQKEFEDLLKGDPLGDALNPLLGMNGLNIHLDTPTEILHTVLLGIVKYFWGQTVFLLEKSKLLNIFQNCLESINKDGLKAPCLSADYICHYKGSLIGKHFKSLAQTAVRQLHDKRAAKESDKMQEQTLECLESENRAGPGTSIVPAFDRAPIQPKSTCKERTTTAKGPTKARGKGKRKKVSSNPDAVVGVAGLSGQQLPIQLCSTVPPVANNQAYQTFHMQADHPSPHLPVPGLLQFHGPQAGPSRHWPPSGYQWSMPSGPQYLNWQPPTQFVSYSNPSIQDSHPQQPLPPSSSSANEKRPHQSRARRDSKPM